MKISIFFISIFIILPLQASFETDIPLETSLGHIQTSLEDAGGKPIHLVIGGVPSEDHLKTQDFVRIYLDNNYLKALSTPREPLVQGNFNTIEVWSSLQTYFSDTFDAIYFDISVIKFIKWDNSIMHAVLNCLKSGGQLLIPEALSACDAPRDADVTYLMKDYPLPSMILPQPFSPKTQLPWSPKQEGFFIEYPLWGVCMTTRFDGYWQYCPSRFWSFSRKI